MGKTRTAVVASIVVALASVPSCETGQPSVPDEHLLERFVALQCHDQPRCVLGEDANIERVRAGVEAKRIRIVPSEMHTCLAQPPTLFFPEQLYQVPSCQAALEGTLPDGSACDVDMSCASGFCELESYDRPPPGYWLTSCGVCHPRRAAGEPCDSHGWLGEGHRECRVDDHCGTSGVCEEGPPTTSPSEPDSIDTYGLACKETTTCKNNLRCHDGHCGAVLGLEEPCDDDGSPDRCVAGTECREHTCRALSRIGGPCLQECREGVCKAGKCAFLEAGALCTTDHVMACPPGTACGSESGPFRCMPGSDSPVTTCSETCDVSAVCIGGACSCILANK